jgi:hypothetical protein
MQAGFREGAQGALPCPQHPLRCSTECLPACYLQASVREGFAGTTLVHQDDAIERGIEEASVLWVRAAYRIQGAISPAVRMVGGKGRGRSSTSIGGFTSRATMQEDDGFPVGVAALLPVHGVELGDLGGKKRTMHRCVCVWAWGCVSGRRRGESDAVPTLSMPCW